MKQLRVIVQVRNNLLQQRREELGMNQADLCRACGFGQSWYSALESMRKSPFITDTNKWRKPVLKLAAFHGVPVEDLFPPEVLQMKGGIRHATFDVTEFAQLAAAGPEELLLLREQIGSVRPMLKSLVSSREAMVLTGRFGLDGNEEQSLKDIGHNIDISRERARQLEERALNRMRKEMTSEDPIAKRQAMAVIETEKKTRKARAARRPKRWTQAQQEMLLELAALPHGKLWRAPRRLIPTGVVLSRKGLVKDHGRAPGYGEHIYSITASGLKQVQDAAGCRYAYR